MATNIDIRYCQGDTAKVLGQQLRKTVDSLPDSLAAQSSPVQTHVLFWGPPDAPASSISELASGLPPAIHAIGCAADSVLYGEELLKLQANGHGSWSAVCFSSPFNTSHVGFSDAGRFSEAPAIVDKVVADFVGSFETDVTQALLHGRCLTGGLRRGRLRRKIQAPRHLVSLPARYGCVP